MTSYGGATTFVRSPTTDGSKRSARKGRIWGTASSSATCVAGDGGRKASYDSRGHDARTVPGSTSRPVGGATFWGAETSLLRHRPTSPSGVSVRRPSQSKSIVARLLPIPVLVLIGLAALAAPVAAADSDAPIDGCARPARRSRPRRLVDGDRGSPPQRRTLGHRRTPTRRRHAEPDAVRDTRRPANRLGQDLPPVRAAAGLRARDQGRPRRGRRRDRVGPCRVLGPRRGPAGRGHRGRAAAGHRQRPESPPEPAAAGCGHARTDAGRPAFAGRGVERHRPAGLAGRRLEPPGAGAAGRAPGLAGEWRTAGDRGRDRRSRDTLGVPRHDPPLSSAGDHRCRTPVAHRPPRRAAGERGRRRGPVGRSHWRAGTRLGRRPGRRRRATLRQRARDDRRLRPRHAVDRRDERRRKPLAAACFHSGRRPARSSPTTAS